MEFKDNGITSVFISVDEDFEVEFIRVVDLNDFYVFDITPENFAEFKDRLVETNYLLNNGCSVDEYFSFDNYLSFVAMQDLDNYSIIILWKCKNYNIVYDADDGQVKKLHKNSLYYYLGKKGLYDKAEVLGIKETDEFDKELELDGSGFGYLSVYACGTGILEHTEIANYVNSNILMFPSDVKALCGRMFGIRDRVPSSIDTVVFPKSVEYVVMFNKAYDKDTKIYGLYDFLVSYGNKSIKKICCSRGTKFISLNNSDDSDKFKDCSSSLSDKLEYYD